MKKEGATDDKQVYFSDGQYSRWRCKEKGAY